MLSETSSGMMATLIVGVASCILLAEGTFTFGRFFRSAEMRTSPALHTHIRTFLWEAMDGYFSQFESHCKWPC